LNVFLQSLLSSGRHRKFNLKNSVISNVLSTHNKEFLNLKSLIFPLLIKKNYNNNSYFYKVLSRLYLINLMNFLIFFQKKIILKKRLFLVYDFFIFFCNFFFKSILHLGVNTNFFFSNFFSKYVFFNSRKSLKIGSKKFYFIIKNFIFGFYNFFILII